MKGIGQGLGKVLPYPGQWYGKVDPWQGWHQISAVYTDDVSSVTHRVKLTEDGGPEGRADDALAGEQSDGEFSHVTTWFPRERKSHLTKSASVLERHLGYCCWVRMYAIWFSDPVTVLTARRVRHGVAPDLHLPARLFLASRKAVRMEYTELLASIRLTSIWAPRSQHARLLRRIARNWSSYLTLLLTIMSIQQHG